MIKTSKGDLPIRYSWNALRLIGDALDLTMNEMLSFDLMNRKIGDVFTFVYFGFVEGARLNKEECKISGIEEVGDLLSEDALILEKAITQFAEDMKMIGGKGEESKKK
jgi:hypothetical protein